MTEQTDPTVSSVAITSVTGIQDNWTNAGDIVYATAVFNKSVFGDNASGTTTLTIVVGSDNRTATYVSGSNSTALVFRYTIQSGDTDDNGTSIRANALALNSGTIRDASGNYATITHNSVPDNDSYMVATPAPTLEEFYTFTVDASS